MKIVVCISLYNIMVIMKLITTIIIIIITMIIARGFAAFIKRVVKTRKFYKMKHA